MTDEQKVREAFEAWAKSRPWFAKVAGNLKQTSDGNYCHYKVNDRWMAWQAAFYHASATAERAAVPEGMVLVPQRFVDLVQAASRATHPRAVPQLIEDAIEELAAHTLAGKEG